MQPKVLVIGALGNVGTEVVRSLLARGAAVRAADLSPERARERFGEAVEAVSFDFGDATTYAAAFDGMEGMFLMRPPAIANVKKYLFPAIEAAKAAGVKQVVFLSLIGIEDNQRAPHYAVEQYLKASGMDTTFLRCSFFMQNLNTTHRAEIRERDEIYVPVGQAKTSFIDARDIGAVAALALCEPGHKQKAYDLTGGEALRYDEVAAIFSEVLGRKISYTQPSRLQYFVRQVQQGKPLMFALITTWLYSSTRQGMAERVTGEVKRLLGREPIEMRQYVKDYQANWQ